MAKPYPTSQRGRATARRLARTSIALIKTVYEGALAVNRPARSCNWRRTCWPACEKGSVEDFLWGMAMLAGVSLIYKAMKINH